ncbi:hypothetical protein LPJ53_002922 [Coemansia erecta]|uniref:C2H2-type domain-containing protein n=1 Tax=Coemansia erecta TaxID=147472 RepID=A0A9W8CRC5_9FUNG|nr:hypothetical protein LPJ53_002922 [Coemansia erecta]
MNSFNAFNPTDLILQLLNTASTSSQLVPSCTLDGTNHIDMNSTTTTAVPGNPYPEFGPTIAAPPHVSTPDLVTDKAINEIISAYPQQPEIDMELRQLFGRVDPGSIPALQPTVNDAHMLLNKQIASDPLSFEYLVSSSSIVPHVPVQNPIKASSEKPKSLESRTSADNGPKYLCEICNKKFPRPSALATHVFSHTGEKPYKCEEPGCEQVFSVRSNMQRHMKAKHKRESITKTSRNKRSRYYSSHPYMFPDMLYGAPIHPSQHPELVFYPPAEAPCFFYPHPHPVAFPPLQFPSVAQSNYEHPQLMSQPQPDKDHMLASKLNVELDTLLDMLGNPANNSAAVAAASGHCLAGLGLQVEQPTVPTPISLTATSNPLLTNVSMTAAAPTLISGQPSCGSLDTDSGSLYGETPQTPLSHGLRTPMTSHSAPFYGTASSLPQQACSVSVYMPVLPVASTGIEYSETSRMLNQAYTLYPKQANQV